MYCCTGEEKRKENRSITALAVCPHRADMIELTPGVQYSRRKWKGDVTLRPHKDNIHSDHALHRALTINWINQTTCSWLSSQMQMLCIFASDCESREQSCLLLCSGWRSPGLNVWTPSEVEHVATVVPSCVIADRIDAESQRNRQKDGSRDWGAGKKKKMDDRLGCSFPQPVACGHCAITVGLVWVLYYCTIWRIVIYCVWKECFYPSLILYQVLKESKSIPAYLPNNI